ncbi:hypothetical protein ACJ73_07195 [Blastomyces percursus]|uniref:Uncharacterized protein n=1 Tax=Blastomyces percursus TaxID=1658174 RepID=A0A1J9PYR5_9EURO|nr:hypothetical protein ACJ73_07195 [Blastomyces percursus]
MPKRRHSQVTSSNDGGTTDESSRLDMNSESDCGYETELTEPDSDLSTPVPTKVVDASATNDSDDDTDPEDDTDDEISSGDEDDDYSLGARRLIARMEDYWQRLTEKPFLDTIGSGGAIRAPQVAGPDRRSSRCRAKRSVQALQLALRTEVGEGRSSTEGDEQVELPEGRLEELPMLLRGRDWRQGRCTADAVDAEGKSHSPIGRRLSGLIVVEEPSTAGQEAWAGHIGEGEDAGVCGGHVSTAGDRPADAGEEILARAAADEDLPLQPAGSLHAEPKKNTFILPEIIYEPSLIFSPHNFLFGILFFFGAFKATNLTSMEKLRGLTIGGGRQQKPIPLKPEMADHYVFCKVTKEGGKVRILPEEKMDPSSAIRTIAEICGFLHPWFNHRCRYGEGLVLNKSDKYTPSSLPVRIDRGGSEALTWNHAGLVGDAEQNLVLKHASIRTFLDHYIPRTVSINMQPLISGLDPNAPLMQGDRGAGSGAAGSHPEEGSGRRRRALETNSPEAIEKFARRKDIYRKQVREEFDDEQAVIDIERQLSGMALDEEAKETLEEEQMLPAQIHLLSKLLTWPTSRSVEEELRRRDAGVEAVRCTVASSGVGRAGEGDQRPLHPHPRSRPRRHWSIPTAGTRRMMMFRRRRGVMALRAAEEHIRDAKQPRGCFECTLTPGRRITGAFIDTRCRGPGPPFPG